MKGQTMEIWVDDQPYAMTGDAGQTVGDLANEVCATEQGSGPRLVVALRCDGQPVAADSLSTVLQTPAGRFQQLELLTQPVAALVRSTLDQAISVIEESAATRERAADLLSEGQQEPAMRELQKFLGVWTQMQQALLISARAMKIDLDSLAVGDVTLTRVLDTIKHQFNELRGAMEQSDFVVVADILRYELTAPLQQFTGILKHLRDQCEASAT
jgi:hypothetical protein